MEGFEPARLGELYAAASGFGCRWREVGVRSARGRASVSVLFGISAGLFVAHWKIGRRPGRQPGTNVKPNRTSTKHLIPEISNILIIQTP